MDNLERQLDLVRRWQKGENTVELAQEFEKLSLEMISTHPFVSYEQDVYDTMHEIYETIRWSRYTSSKV